MTESTSANAPATDAEGRVGLIVVSHSRALALAAVTLAGEMLHGRPLTIEVAAGLDDTTFGTDAVSIMQAIERADSPAGVVVLMDLGSAVLSAELALDLLQDSSIRDRVTLSPAPLVEGLIVAAVAAAGGASREEVAAEARDALMGKAAHLSTPEPGVAPEPGDRRRRHRRRVPGGQPARPARATGRPTRQRGARPRCVRPAAQPHHRRRTGPRRQPEPSRDARGSARARGRGARHRAAGPGGRRARPRARQATVRRDPPRPGPRATRSAPTHPSRSGPLAASPGIAIGPARRLAAEPVDPALHPAGEPAQEWRRMVESVAAVRREIEHVRVLTERELGPSRPASSTRTCPSSPTPSCSPTSRRALALAPARLQPGRAASPKWSVSGPSFPTPTSGSGRPTSARSENRCCRL